MKPEIQTKTQELTPRQRKKLHELTVDVDTKFFIISMGVLGLGYLLYRFVPYIH
jgi:hypothetical protein